MLELNLLSSSKANLEVLAHVFKSFLKVIRQKEKNIFLLIQQVKNTFKCDQYLLNSYPNFSFADL